MSSNIDFERIIYLYKVAMSTSGTLSIFSSSLAIYLIAYKSAPEMAQYRFYLYNIVLWAFFHDIYISLFFTPSFEFPANGACIFGLLRKFENFIANQLICVMTLVLLSGVAISIVCAFIYRLAAITNSIPKLHNKWSISLIVLAHVLYLFPMWGLGLYAVNYNYEEVLTDVKQRHPDTYNFNLKYSCVYVSRNVTPTLLNIYAMISIIQILTLFILIGVLSFIIIRKIELMKSKISSKSFSLQRQLILSLIVQFFLPFITLAIPSLVITIISHLHSIDEIWIRVSGLSSYVIMSLHSSFNCVAMIIMIKPYRQAVLNKFSSTIFPINDTTSVTVFSNKNRA